MEFAARIFVYVGFLVFAAIFYRNIVDMPIEARTMPMMAIFAVVFLAGLLLISDVVKAFRVRSIKDAVLPVAAVASDTSADASSQPGEQDEKADSERIRPPEPTVAGDGLEPGRVLSQVVPASLLIAAYIYFLPIVGFVIASVLFLGILAYLLGARSPVKIAIFAIVFPFAFEWLFETILQLRLP